MGLMAAEAAAVAALVKSSMGLTSAGEGGVRRAELVLCRLGGNSIDILGMSPNLYVTKSLGVTALLPCLNPAVRAS